MTLAAQEMLARRQELAAQAHERMLNVLIGFEPCSGLKIRDIRFIADMARTIAFDAMTAADA